MNRITNKIKSNGLGYCIFKAAAVVFDKIARKFDKKPDDTNWALFSWTSCLENLELDCDACFFGNSITRGSKFQKVFRDKKICNLGYSGDTVDGMEKRIDMLKAVNAKKIFVMAGINDILGKSSAEITAEKVCRLTDRIIKALPDTAVYLQSVLPINEEKQNNFGVNAKIVKLNSILGQYAADNGIVFIDIFDEYCRDGGLPAEWTKDGIHFSSESVYQPWAEAIKKYI